MRPVKHRFSMTVCTVLASLAMPAPAALYDRGGGLIYDDVLDVTWLQDAAYHVTTGAANVDANGRMLWQDAMDWIASLSYPDTVRNVDWDDWRLPVMLPVNGVAYDLNYSYEGLTDNGYNITAPASELSYMYHINLGGVSLVSTTGVFDPGAAGIANPSPFTGFNGGVWSQTEVPGDPAMIFILGMGNGHQNWFDKTTVRAPWAVRDGDVAITPDGDMNEDGQVNLADILIALQIFHGTRIATTEQLLHGDVAPLVMNVPAPDGQIDIGDILVIQRKAQGFVSFP